MTDQEDNMISISHWGMFEKKPIEIERRPKQFERVFPFPNLTNKDEFKAWFLDIKA